MTEHDLILKVRTGSHCHGTSLPESDEDIRGVCIPNLHYFFGIKNFEQYEDKEADIVFYGIQKFIALCCKGNLSALNFLFTNKRDILYFNEWGEKLLKNRSMFLSKQVVDCILGYTKSQIHRMGRGSGRCGKREELVAKHGYDTKFAYHAFMITKIGVELLKTNTYNAMRTDGEQKIIREIRTGKLKYEHTMALIQENLTVIKTLEPLCNLPAQPDRELISEFSVSLLKDYFKSK